MNENNENKAQYDLRRRYDNAKKCYD